MRRNHPRARPGADRVPPHLLQRPPGARPAPCWAGRSRPLGLTRDAPPGHAGRPAHLLPPRPHRARPRRCSGRGADPAAARRVIRFLVVGTIPAVIAGLAFGGFFEDAFAPALREQRRAGLHRASSSSALERFGERAARHAARRQAGPRHRRRPGAGHPARASPGRGRPSGPASWPGSPGRRPPGSRSSCRSRPSPAPGPRRGRGRPRRHRRRLGGRDGGRRGRRLPVDPLPAAVRADPLPDGLRRYLCRLRARCRPWSSGCGASRRLHGRKRSRRSSSTTAASCRPRPSSASPSSSGTGLPGEVAGACSSGGPARRGAAGRHRRRRRHRRGRAVYDARTADAGLAPARDRPPHPRRVPRPARGPLRGRPRAAPRPRFYAQFLEELGVGVHWMMVHRVRELRAEGYRTAILTNNVKEWGDVLEGVDPPRPLRRGRRLLRRRAAQARPGDLPAHLRAARSRPRGGRVPRRQPRPRGRGPRVGLHAILVRDPEEALAELDALLAGASQRV